MKRVALLAVLVLVASASAVAQSREGRISPALALARVCVSEANWDCFETGDGLAIHEVLLRGADRHGMSYTSFAAAYSGRVVGTRTPTTTRGRWIRELDESGEAPSSWPTHITRRVGGAAHVRPMLPWAHYRESWMAVLERARQAVRDYTLDNITDWGVCASPVHDWGGSMDRGRAERLRLIEVECGETSNDFYARPHLVSR